MDTSRRRFLQKAGTLGVGLMAGGILAMPNIWAKVAPKAMEKPEEEEVAPAEDLMREHGVLERLLLIYEESSHRLVTQTDMSPDVLATAARITRNFVEDYHEKLEENYIFPRLKKAKQQVDLVSTLLAQHQVGRKLTDSILHYANLTSFKNPDESQQLITALNQYIRMYRPHASREDTVLFPAFKSVVSAHEYSALGELFEDEEHRLFGKAGFEGVVGEIAELEKQLGIYNLTQFTPAV